MEEKIKFAKFILDKRKEADLTQKELAQRLFVTDTTISKWERGLSYPDITLIPAICSELSISEHEFFIACEDVAAREERKQAGRYRKLGKITFWSLNISYLIGILTCFICNLAIDHTLSWFFIVLVSVALSFSITGLPVILKQNRTLAVFVSATVLTYLLMLVCSLYTGGDWFFQAAMPITTLSVAWCWLLMLIIRYIKMNYWLKAGIILAIAAIITLTMNPFLGYILNVNQGSVLDYLNLMDWTPERIGNKIVIYVLVFFSVFSFLVGVNKTR